GPPCRRLAPPQLRQRNPGKGKTPRPCPLRRPALSTDGRHVRIGQPRHADKGKPCPGPNRRLGIPRDENCRRGDSNPYALRHWLLRPARLPIPPLLRPKKAR